jgi:uncharacterized protein YjbJ (UPF0337 family)
VQEVFPNGGRIRSWRLALQPWNLENGSAAEPENRCRVTCLTCGHLTPARPYMFQPEADMDWNRIEGNWKQIKGTVKQKWGQLTDDDLNQVNGSRDILEGKIQERYGIAKDMVRKDIDDWLKSQP